MEPTVTATTQKTKGCNCPVLRFVFNNATVFELICKTLIMALIIPYGSLFLNGLIFDKLLNVYAQSAAWPIVILSIMLLLFILGVTLSVISITRFIKKIKTVSR